MVSVVNIYICVSTSMCAGLLLVQYMLNRRGRQPCDTRPYYGLKTMAVKLGRLWVYLCDCQQVQQEGKSWWCKSISICQALFAEWQFSNQGNAAQVLSCRGVYARILQWLDFTKSSKILEWLNLSNQWGKLPALPYLSNWTPLAIGLALYVNRHTTLQTQTAWQNGSLLKLVTYCREWASFEAGDSIATAVYCLLICNDAKSYVRMHRSALEWSRHIAKGGGISRKNASL